MREKLEKLRTLNRTDVIDRVENVAERIQTVCLLLDNIQYLGSVANAVEVYSEHPDVNGDLLSVCVSELLSAADKLNCIGEDCRQYEIEKPDCGASYEEE